MKGIRVAIEGAVQGVGFRPYVLRLARDLGLYGWVKNNPQGVVIHLEGQSAGIDSFLKQLKTEGPPRAKIERVICRTTAPRDYHTFKIRRSQALGLRSTRVLPDLALCDDCRKDIFDSSNRRHHYPFTNCTNCGPRFSILNSLPYDRENTTMRSFKMCADCQKEYDNPSNRRFHAQPNACPTCGPHLTFCNPKRNVLGRREEALEKAAGIVSRGQILALKGLGGFHLMVDARNEEGVRTLRGRKNRAQKPFAVMFPDLKSIKAACAVNETEEELLMSAESPIVILKMHPGGLEKAGLAPSLAPGLNCLGVFLPYTPLHTLLLKILGFPVVATSGNLSEEPICIDEEEAFNRLGGIADGFLIHNRPIVRPMDDSVFHVVLDGPVPLRLGRGQAPVALTCGIEPLPSLVAEGSYLKNTLALTVGKDIVLSQHIGDLDNADTIESRKKSKESLLRLYGLTPTTIVADAHPDYASTPTTSAPIPVQHHWAHVASVMAENRLEGPLLGIAWDGSGYGLDGTIWGGEFLDVQKSGWSRWATLRPFPLAGGDKAVAEPRRTALALLWVHADQLEEVKDLPSYAAFSEDERRSIIQMLKKKINTPLTSSMGRLFDAVSSLAGGSQTITYEGQAAMEFEQAMDPHETGAYPFPFLSGVSTPPYYLDWEPLLQAVIRDVRDKKSIGTISSKFHNALIEATRALVHESGHKTVVVSGGCFQNRYLLEKTIRRLTADGIHVYWNRLVPANDGGLALGQAYAATLALKGAVPCA